MSENMIQNRRGRTRKTVPLRFSQRKCARIARNSFSHALNIENANEMRESPVESHFRSNMLFSADVSGWNVSHSQSEARPRFRSFSDQFPNPFPEEVP